MKRLFAAALAGFLAGVPVYAGKNDGLAIPGVGANRNTDVLQVDHTDSKVEIQLYHLRVGTGSTPDVTPGADDVFIEGTLEVDGATRFDGALTQGGDITVTGTTPAVTIGDAGAEDTSLIYDGNAVDFHISLDDSADKLVISTGSTPGTANRIAINSADQGIILGDASQTDVWVTFDGNADDFHIGLDDSSDDLVVGYGGTVGTDPRLTVVDDASSTQLVVGDAAAEDMQIRFDGNAQDFHIGLDDSTDDLVFGLGSALGTTPAFAIDENQDVTFTQDIFANANISTTGDDVDISTHVAITGTVTLSGGLTLSDPYSATETELQATTPTVVGQIYYDESNLAMVISTGIVNAASFGLIYAGTSTPTGW